MEIYQKTREEIVLRQQEELPVEPDELLATVNALLRLRKAEQALHQSDIRMRALLDASQDEILLLSTQGEVLAINKAAERRLGEADGRGRLRWAPISISCCRRTKRRQRIAIVRQVASTAKREFRYDPTSDTYRCPGGQQLYPLYRCVKGGHTTVAPNLVVIPDLYAVDTGQRASLDESQQGTLISTFFMVYPSNVRSKSAGLRVWPQSHRPANRT